MQVKISFLLRKHYNILFFWHVICSKASSAVINKTSIDPSSNIVLTFAFNSQLSITTLKKKLLLC